jgi:proteasome accessory factor A
VASNSDASQRDVFQRLVGLETEYALFTPSLIGLSGSPAKQRQNRHALFHELIAALQSKIPCVRARSMKEGVFHAAGGAVWFETERPAVGGGLIEGSTPECRSPRQLLIWQRAQDEMLADAADTAFGNAVRLIKNDRDAEGNIYGAQENYEATVAIGWRLAVWRTALIALLPLAAITWLLLWLIDVAVTCYALAATVVYLTAERLFPRPERLSRLLFGCSVKELAAETPTGPAWLEAILSVVARVLTAPLAIALFAVLWFIAFVRIRRELTPFLLSRAIVAGSGMVDEQGRFQLADKAAAMNCLTGFGGLLGDRPIFCLGHFFKTVYADAWLAPQQYARLFVRRQRLQIALGDSNLAETAEYLRVATTLLVIDAIEAGEMPPVPAVKRPIGSLRSICADPTLAARVPLAGGKKATALEIQRFYFEACRRFLARRPAAPDEAREVLRRWEIALDALGDNPQSLVGTLDWVTKRFILAKSGKGAAWDVCKKIDIRYHELSPQGYFQRLKATGVVNELVSQSEVDHARRNPPANTPAAVRGRYIREFSDDEHGMSANWQAVFLGQGREVKVVRLDRYQQKVNDGTASSKRRERGDKFN